MANGDGYTRFPNWLLDEAMPNCDSSEWAILCAVVRNTAGWNKPSQRMSIADFSTATGIKGRQNITRAVKSLLDKGYLERESDGQAFIYCVPTSNDSLLVTKDNQSRIVTSTSNDSLPELVTKSNQFTPTLKKGKKDKEIYIDPLPESVTKMISSLSRASKTPYGAGFNEELYEQAANLLLRQGFTTEQVDSFPEYWLSMGWGWRRGLPTIEKVVEEMGNCVNRVDTRAEKDKNPGQSNFNGKHVDNPEFTHT